MSWLVGLRKFEQQLIRKFEKHLMSLTVIIQTNENFSYQICRSLRVELGRIDAVLRGDHFAPFKWIFCWRVSFCLTVTYLLKTFARSFWLIDGALLELVEFVLIYQFCVKNDVMSWLVGLEKFEINDVWMTGLVGWSEISKMRMTSFRTGT